MIISVEQSIKPQNNHFKEPEDNEFNKKKDFVSYSP